MLHAMLRWIVLLLLAVAPWEAGTLAPETSWARAEQPSPALRKIFVVQSYNPEYVWTRAITQGLHEALHNVPLTWHTVYLDAKRRPDAEVRQAAASVLQEIQAVDPDVVVAVDDAAMAHVVTPALKGLARPQVIFCGINAPLSHYGLPASNVSGVRERWHYREGFALLKQLIPQARSVAFLVDDSESGRYVLEKLHQDMTELGEYSLQLAGAETVRTFEDWKKRILHYQHHADALALGLYNSLVDENGTVVDPDEVMAWTNSVNTLPTLGFTDIALEHGLLCGILESGHEQGYLAGGMVREVLAGTPAGRLESRINVHGVVMLNLITAEKMQLPLPYEIIEAADVVLR